MSNIKNSVINIFANFGLTKEHAKVYVDLITNGESNVQSISGNTGIARSTCYNILDKLSWEGLVSSRKDGNKNTIYIAEDPSVLKSKLQEKSAEVDTAFNEFANIQSSLESFSRRTTSAYTDVRFYEGESHMKKLLFDLLEQSNGKEILSVCQGIPNKDSDLSEDPDYLLNYFNRLDKYNITERAILEDLKSNRQFIEKYSQPNCEYRLSPQLERNDTAHIDKYIFSDTVIIFNFEKHYAVLIKDQYIANYEKIMFDIAWNGLI